MSHGGITGDDPSATLRTSGDSGSMGPRGNDHREGLGQDSGGKKNSGREEAAGRLPRNPETGCGRKEGGKEGGFGSCGKKLMVGSQSVVPQQCTNAIRLKKNPSNRSAPPPSNAGKTVTSAAYTMAPGCAGVGAGVGAAVAVGEAGIPLRGIRDSR